LLTIYASIPGCPDPQEADIPSPDLKVSDLLDLGSFAAIGKAVPPRDPDETMMRPKTKRTARRTRS
jgi:hypothetical protein